MRMRPKEMALFLSSREVRREGRMAAIRDGMNSRRITHDRSDLAVLLDFELNRNGDQFHVEDDDDAVTVTRGKRTARLTLKTLVNDDTSDLMRMGAFRVQSN